MIMNVKKWLMKSIQSILKDPLKIINDKGDIEDIGTVRQVIENETGLKVYVVESPDRYLWYTISKSVHDIFVK